MTEMDYMHFSINLMIECQQDDVRTNKLKVSE